MPVFLAVGAGVFAVAGGLEPGLLLPPGCGPSPGRYCVGFFFAGNALPGNDFFFCTASPGRVCRPGGTFFFLAIANHSHHPGQIPAQPSRLVDTVLRVPVVEPLIRLQ